MYQINISSNAFQLVKDLERFKKELNTTIKIGLDKPLSDSVQELKDVLLSVINKDIKDNKTQSANTLNEKDLDIPKSQDEIIKHLTNVDLNQIRTKKDYTTFVENKALIVNEHRVRLRIPMSGAETFDMQHSQAISFFNKATFIFNDGQGNLSYHINPGIDMSQYVKVVCSRDTGDTPKSRKKFDNYKNSKKMPRQDSSEIGRFSEWSLKQDAVKYIKQAFININPIIKDIQNGDYDDALLKLHTSYSGNNPNIQNVKNKVEELRDKKNLQPSTEAYSNIISLIRNMKFAKSIAPTAVRYTLISNYNSSAEQEANEKIFMDEIQRQIFIWGSINEKLWFYKLAQVIEKFIERFY
jgi:hypothetical protein